MVVVQKKSTRFYSMYIYSVESIWWFKYCARSCYWQTIFNGVLDSKRYHQKKCIIIKSRI